MEKKKNIDDLFKEQLGNYAETPPPAVWDALEKKLSGLPPSGSGLFYKWSPYFIIMSALIVLGVLVAGKMQSFPGITANPLKTAGDNATVTNKAQSKTLIANNKEPLKTTNNNSAVNNNESNNTNSPNEKPIIGDNNINTNKGIISANTKNSNKIAEAVKTNKLSGKDLSVNDKGASPSKTGANNISGKKKNHNSNTTKLSSSKKRTHRGQNKNEGINAFAANKENTTNDPTPLNDYGSNTGKATGNLPAPITNEESQLPGTFKAAAPDPIKQSIDHPVINKTDPKVVAAKKINKFEAGIKAGYEGGFNSGSGKKTVLSPYVSYKLSSKLSLMLQPAIKYAHVNNKSLSGTQSFYKENNDSAATLNKVPVYVANMQDTLYNESIVYSQTHDSIVKSYTSGGTYIEFEIPVLLKYNISKKCSFYGGVTMNYSGYVHINEHTYTSAPILKTSTTPLGILENPADPVYSTVSSQILYTGNSINDYKAPLYSTPNGGLLRAGYMLGFNYEYSNRWLFDALMQQASAKPLVTGGYNTNTPFSAPYFRITLGYKIF